MKKAFSLIEIVVSIIIFIIGILGVYKIYLSSFNMQDKIKKEAIALNFAQARLQYLISKRQNIDLYTTFLSIYEYSDTSQININDAFTYSNMPGFSNQVEFSNFYIKTYITKNKDFDDCYNIEVKVNYDIKNNREVKLFTIVKK